MTSEMDRDQVRYGGCVYCAGIRDPNCTCTTDCGARADDTGHVCPKAPPDVVAAWLRGTGLYSEEEIARWAGT